MVAQPLVEDFASKTAVAAYFAILAIGGELPLQEIYCEGLEDIIFVQVKD